MTNKINDREVQRYKTRWDQLGSGEGLEYGDLRDPEDGSDSHMEADVSYDVEIPDVTDSRETRLTSGMQGSTEELYSDEDILFALADWYNWGDKSDHDLGIRWGYSEAEYDPDNKDMSPEHVSGRVLLIGDDGKTVATITNIKVLEIDKCWGA